MENKIIEEKTDDRPVSEVLPEKGFVKITCIDGAVIYWPVGLNPDRLFNERDDREWPFSRVISSVVLQLVTEGHSLVAICKQDGFPPYRVILNWKMRNSDFRKDLTRAYRDKAEYAAEQAMSIAKKSFGSYGDKLKVDALKWSSSVNDPSKFSPAARRAGGGKKTARNEILMAYEMGKVEKEKKD